MSDSRLQSIYFHAGRLFNTKRYANTKVSEIAAAAGVATGTIYNLFTSKKAILTFVIRASLERDYLDGDIGLPIGEADTKLLLELCSRLHDRTFNHILQITDAEGKVCRSFVQMLSDIFDMEADSLLAFNNVEHNAGILCEIADVFFPARKRFRQVMEENLTTYMDLGEVRQLDYPRIHVKCIDGILTWWAMNAYIAMPDVTIQRESAREIAVDLIARAYLTKYNNNMK